MGRCWDFRWVFLLMTLLFDFYWGILCHGRVFVEKPPPPQVPWRRQRRPYYLRLKIWTSTEPPLRTGDGDVRSSGPTEVIRRTRRLETRRKTTRFLPTPSNPRGEDQGLRLSQEWHTLDPTRERDRELNLCGSQVTEGDSQSHTVCKTQSICTGVKEEFHQG